MLSQTHAKSILNHTRKARRTRFPVYRKMVRGHRIHTAFVPNQHSGNTIKHTRKIKKIVHGIDVFLIDKFFLIRFLFEKKFCLFD